MIKDTRLDKNANWKGGRVVRDGYVYLKMPEHHLALQNGYVAEHRVIAEAKTGHPLASDEHVHHISGIRDDNRPENLEVMTVGDHRRLHDAKDGNPRYRKDIDTDQLLTMWRSGKGPKEIATTLRIPLTTVCRRLAVERRSSHPKRHALDLDELKRLRDEGLSYAAIAERIGVSTMSVFRRLSGEIKC